MSWAKQNSNHDEDACIDWARKKWSDTCVMYMYTPMAVVIDNSLPI